MIYLLIFGIFLSFYICVWRPAVKRYYLGLLENQAVFSDSERALFSDMLNGLNEALDKYKKENELLNGNKQPTDEDIEKYYKMYLIKFKLDQESEKNVWSVEEPMTFDEWKTNLSKHIESGLNGYRFLVSNTSDVMVGFPPDVIYQRLRDYESMIPEYEEMMKDE